MIARCDPLERQKVIMSPALYSKIWCDGCSEVKGAYRAYKLMIQTLPLNSVWELENNEINDVCDKQTNINRKWFY